uniref:Non-specific lipid-transfer protein n=1 Tax=Leersia perrieri TaxID=77586 RepID=A0A0D9WHQ1_9ORYZ
MAAAAVLLAALLVLSVSSPARAALSCSTVYNTLLPCMHYVQSGGAVPAACCGGISSVVAAANTTADRRAACNCLKNVFAGAAGGPFISRAAALPGRCDVSAPFKISPNVNCSAYGKLSGILGLRRVGLGARENVVVRQLYLFQREDE